MAPRIGIYRAKDAHALELAGVMRAADVCEVLAGGFESPLECLRWGLATSSAAITVTINGEVAAMLGVSHAGPGKGHAWLLTGRQVQRFPKVFLEWSRPLLRLLARPFEQLVCEVDTRYHQAVRWLEWLGAKAGPTHQVGDVWFQEYCLAGGCDG